MRDEKQWALADAQFKALRTNIPNYVNEDLVNEYNAIVTLFESATDESLTAFRIPPSKVAPRMTSFQMGNPKSATYSKVKFCDTTYFKRQVEGLASYLPSLRPSTGVSVISRDYDALTDEQLEDLAHTHHIDGYGNAQGPGIERGIIISRLRERDRSLQPPQQVHHSLHIGHVTGSIIQQSPSHSPATLNYQPTEVRNVIEQIKSALDSLPVSLEAKNELGIEISTIELQLSSPNPKNRVIAECLHSARAILEGITGSLIASGIVHSITQILGQ